MNGLCAAALALVFATALTPSISLAQEDLTKLSLEDLLATQVTSVAKKPQRVDEAAAAIFVIDQDDIRRSGATSIPDLLRMVPGLEVAELPSGGAAVSARGFNGFSSNKLLVLVDGRAIYLSAFSGVFWDQQLVPVDSIQRIEVVRGPGATLWGANAVNGVINIVTKHTVDTLGAAATGQADTANGQRFDARYGAQIGDTGALRVYVTGHRRDGVARYGALDIGDHTNGLQGGFRFDLDASDKDTLTAQGDIQTGSTHFPAAYAVIPVGLPLPTASDFSGANLLGRWSRTWDDQTGMALQVYWDHVRRSETGLTGGADQIDVDLSTHFNLGPRNALIWGAGYRSTSDSVAGTSFVFLTPGHRRDAWYGSYLEDDITLVPDRLNLSVGAKIEHNDYSGFEFQPSVRAIWRSPNGWSVWGAVSRAVRTPSHFETGLTILTPAFEALPSVLGSEKMTAYEVGWRGELAPGFALDVTGYDQVYSDLIAQAITGAAGPAGPFIAQFGNRTSGRNLGVEAALTAKLTPTWTIKAAGSWQDLTIASAGLLAGATGNAISQGASPRAQVSIRSQWNVTDDIDFDAWLRHVGELKTGPVPAYTDLDLRLAWRPSAHLELSLSGLNLLNRERIEFGATSLPFNAVVQRSGQIGLSVRY